MSIRLVSEAEYCDLLLEADAVVPDAAVASTLAEAAGLSEISCSRHNPSLKEPP